MPRVLLQNSWVTLTVDDRTGLVRYLRSQVPFETVAQVGETHGAVSNAVSALGKRDDLALLIDSRLAPPRNDPAFEQAITRAMTDLLPRFPKSAFLMKSAAGVLQSHRLGRQTNATLSVFTDETAAMRHLGV